MGRVTKHERQKWCLTDMCPKLEYNVFLGPTRDYQVIEQYILGHIDNCQLDEAVVYLQ